MCTNKRLRSFIEKHNINQKELAKIAGVTEGTVSQWLSGTTLPKIGRLQRITEHFGLPVSILIDENKTTSLIVKHLKFHTRLRDLRKINNMTQEELSAKMGVSAASVGLYEQGRRNPDNETLIKLASIFNVSVDYLLGFDDMKNTFSYGGSDKKVIQADDFTYAMFEESKDLTDEQKEALLAMARAFKRTK